MFVLQLLSLSVLYVSIVLQFIFIMLRGSMSGVPSKDLPFPRTTTNLHILHFIGSIFTLHMSNCVIVVLLYILIEGF